MKKISLRKLAIVLLIFSIWIGEISFTVIHPEIEGWVDGSGPQTSYSLGERLFIVCTLGAFVFPLTTIFCAATIVGPLIGFYFLFTRFIFNKIDSSSSSKEPSKYRKLKEKNKKLKDVIKTLTVRNKRLNEYSRFDMMEMNNK